MDNKFGKMVLNMMDSGNEIKLMAMVHSFMLMAIFMKVNGSMIKHMDMELISMPMALLM
jgi:hypothetical protein